MKCFAKVLVACAAAVVAASADSDATPAEATFDGKFSLLSTFEGAKTASEHGWIKSENAAFKGQFVNIVPGGTKKLPTNDSYEVAFTEGLTCGGAYMKLVAQPAEGHWEPSQLTPDTPYSVMFGPDVCGSTNKVHLILKVRNPVDGEWKEHHLKSAPAAVGVTDTHTHLYGLTLGKDNTYSISADGEVLVSGSVFDKDAFEPPLQAPEVVDDPEDQKPLDWVDEAKIPDPDASKPDDWDEDAPRTIPDADAKKPEGWLDDEPAQIPDPEAEQPEDWDEEEDGEWEAPVISNPKCEAAPGCGEWIRPKIKNPQYKGKWSAPMIDNPEYKGEWKPREISNPAYFKSQGVADLAPVVGAAVEVWTMSGGLQFDNVLLTDESHAVPAWIQATWEPKFAAQTAASASAQASARAAARADAWASGDYGQFLMLSFGSLVEAAMQNMMVTGLTVATLFGVLLYGCFSCCGPDEFEEESDSRRAVAEAFAKVQEADDAHDDHGAEEAAMDAADSDDDDAAGVMQRSTAAGVSAEADADQDEGGSHADAGTPEGVKEE